MSAIEHGSRCRCGECVWGRIWHGGELRVFFSVATRDGASPSVLEAAFDLAATFGHEEECERLDRLCREARAPRVTLPMRARGTIRGMGRPMP